MRTCQDRLKSLDGCVDAASLRLAVGELCTEFGELRRLAIFTMSEAKRRRALCLLRLDSAAQERKLMTTLGAARFGDDLLLVVDLTENATAH